MMWLRSIILVTLLGVLAFDKPHFDSYGFVFNMVVQSIDQTHYNPIALNDSTSMRLFNRCINTELNKKLLTAQDSVELSRYKLELDDQIIGENLVFFKMYVERIKTRIQEKKSWSEALLQEPILLETTDVYETDGDKQHFSKSAFDLKNEWRKMILYQVMVRVDEGLTALEKKSTKPTKYQNDSILNDARQKTLKNQNEWIKRLERRTEKEYFGEFVNHFTSLLDPHTQFFAPVERKRFDQSMSGQFEGIGARLQQKDGILKVSEIIIGSPSYKQGELKAGDDILKVAQGSNEPVDITDMEMEDAIELIKGKKGTEVRLTVRKNDNSTKVISIIRDVIEIEETFAKSAVLKNNDLQGYIYLPSFYTDFTRNGAHHCSQDVRREIEKLKSQGIKGLILDLRDNGGGSLQEAVDLAGLFIDRGPVVQVRSKFQDIRVLEDINAGVVWDGPLVILVNHNSASASEILAAAIQDYKRGCIVGTQSFGKGTVQSFIDLDQMVPEHLVALKPTGSVKVTQQKFYRINGGSTQLKGVSPDLMLPDPYEYIDLGEKEMFNPMPWDQIASAKTKTYKMRSLDELRKKSNQRISTQAGFEYLKKQALRVKSKKENTAVPLQLVLFRKQQQVWRDEAKELEANKKSISGFGASLLPNDLKRIESDTSRKNRELKWVEALSKDLYLYESSQIVKDLKN